MYCFLEADSIAFYLFAVVLSTNRIFLALMLRNGLHGSNSETHRICKVFVTLVLIVLFLSIVSDCFHLWSTPVPLNRYFVGGRLVALIFTVTELAIVTLFMRELSQEGSTPHSPPGPPEITPSPST